MPEILTGGSSLRTPMSLDEYLALGETRHAEFYDGVCVVNPPTRQHERVVGILRRAIEAVCPAGLEVMTGWGWMTGPARYFEPDLMVCEVDASDDDILRDPAPLLVVEVSSPSTRGEDRGVKFAEYSRAGAAWYWLADLDPAAIAVFENVEGEFVERARFTAASVVPGPFTVNVDPASFPPR